MCASEPVKAAARQPQAETAAAGGPAIAVILPTCGRPQLLARALASVIGQSFRDWECVVVNDGPAARATVDALLLRVGDPRIKAWHTLTNQGVAAARNAGIACTTAPYLAFLDDDDYWLPNHLQGVLAAHVGSDEPTVVYTDFIQRWDEDLVAPRLTAAKSSPADVTQGLLAGTYNILTMSTVSLPRRCLAEIGPFDPLLKTGQDWDLYVRASAHYRFLRLPQYSVVYFHHFQDRLTLDYESRVNSLKIIRDKWHLDKIFLNQKMKHWKYMALDAMILASARKDWHGKRKALKYFFAFPAPLGTPLVLVKLLMVALLPFSVYSATVRCWQREREGAARRLLATLTPRECGDRAARYDAPPK